MIAVASEVGQTPAWVMKNFTYPQLFLFYAKAAEARFDTLELQARLVWAVANGWKKPKDVEATIEDLKKAGMVDEK